jgi:hypothetical protein
MSDNYNIYCTLKTKSETRQRKERRRIFGELYLITKYDIWGKAVQALAKTAEDAEYLCQNEGGLLTKMLHYLGFRGAANYIRITRDGFYDCDGVRIGPADDYANGCPMYMFSGWKQGKQVSIICNVSGMPQSLAEWNKQGDCKHIAFNEISCKGIYLIHGNNKKTKISVSTYAGCKCGREYLSVPYTKRINIDFGNHSA